MSPGRLPAGVRAVYFDAVGTLIFPEPSAGDAYHAAGRRHGSRLGRAEVGRRFAAAFAEQERLDEAAAWATDEEREMRRWQAIVAAVLTDVADPEACFRELYAHFARPGAWRCEPAAGRVLTALAAAGYRVGIASNFDARLRGVVAGLPELAGLPLDLVISSEVGWRKPAAAFFARLTAGRPDEVLLVGDDVANDLHGATAFGLRALLLDSAADGPDRIRSLEELIGP